MTSGAENATIYRSEARRRQQEAGRRPETARLASEYAGFDEHGAGPVSVDSASVDSAREACLMPSDYQRMAAAIEDLAAHFRTPPSLAVVAARQGMSPFHFQRLFRQWTGVSPKRFVQALAGDVLERHLAAGRTVLESTGEAGLSAPSRGHALAIHLRGMTPGELRRGAAALAIRWGLHETPLGACLIARTERGICELRFVEASDDAEADLRARWPHARLEAAPAATGDVADALLAASEKRGPLSLHVKGTNFQLRVWQALLALPAGETTTYQAVAASADAPSAARAVGNAIGQNPVAVLIPCHRVLRANGALGGYAWGLARKRSLLALEQARAETRR